VHLPDGGGFFLQPEDDVIVTAGEVIDFAGAFDFKAPAAVVGNGGAAHGDFGIAGAEADAFDGVAQLFEADAIAGSEGEVDADAWINGDFFDAANFP
jgi:hypothetical protein